ncbi:MAG TPA: PEP-CTERM sorting domain-containing protein [Anaerohalosphaeraceae bacterium]|nr:PEP-CTERM sorting domain-containing protein [Anaerohalosphaeraceae bacterium]
MKRFAFLTWLALSLPVMAGYTYVVTQGIELAYVPTLQNHESLLMTGGGGDMLRLYDWSTADIFGTTPYNPDYLGGIHILGVTHNAHLNFYGGEVHEISVSVDGTALLSGGCIDRLTTSQSIWKWVGQPAELIWNPHVTMVCSTHTYNTATKLLTGTWLDGTAFSIQLIDSAGYAATIDNIRFIPEPATLLLLGLGGVLLRRRK